MPPFHRGVHFIALFRGCLIQGAACLSAESVHLHARRTTPSSPLQRPHTVRRVPMARNLFAALFSVLTDLSAGISSNRIQRLQNRTTRERISYPHLLNNHSVISRLARQTGVTIQLSGLSKFRRHCQLPSSPNRLFLYRRATFFPKFPDPFGVPESFSGGTTF